MCVQCTYNSCVKASELCNVCCTVSVCVCCVAHTEFALRWLPAGSLSADAHLHRDLAEGMGEHRQTCTHKQTDEYARAKHGETFRETHNDEHRCLKTADRGFVMIGLQQSNHPNVQAFHKTLRALFFLSYFELIQSVLLVVVCLCVLFVLRYFWIVCSGFICLIGVHRRGAMFD